MTSSNLVPQIVGYSVKRTSSAALPNRITQLRLQDSEPLQLNSTSTRASKIMRTIPTLIAHSMLVSWNFIRWCCYMIAYMLIGRISTMLRSNSRYIPPQLPQSITSCAPYAYKSRSFVGSSVQGSLLAFLETIARYFGIFPAATNDDNFPESSK